MRVCCRPLTSCYKRVVGEYASEAAANGRRRAARQIAHRRCCCPRLRALLPLPLSRRWLPAAVQPGAWAAPAFGVPLRARLALRTAQLAAALRGHRALRSALKDPQRTVRYRDTLY